MAHTSLSRGEHTQTDRAFPLIKESVWVDLAVGCMGRGGGGGGGGHDLYYWWQWLHNFSMQDCFQSMACIWAIYHRQVYNLGVHVVKRYMTIARPCTHLNQSYGFSKHLYVRFSFCAAQLALAAEHWWVDLRAVFGYVKVEAIYQ